MSRPALRRRLNDVLRELSEQATDPSVSPLAAATVLDALRSVKDADVVTKSMARRLALLLDEQWIATADLGTVFSVLAALHAYRPTTVQGRHLAYALKRLMSCELAPGGPYCSASGKAEPAANAAVARFLRRYDVDLPVLTKYLDDYALQDVGDSDVITETFRYLVAPVLSVSGKAALADKLSTDQHPKLPPHPQRAAMALVTLHTLGNRSRPDAAVLVQPLTQPLSIYAGLADLERKLLANALLAEALTIALAPVKAKTAVVVGSARLCADILRDTKRYMTDLPAELRVTGLAAWDAMCRADHNHEIVLMPQLFVDILHDAPPVNDQQLRLLGAANFFCWISAMIYDDFIDEEGEPARLPLANTTCRLSLSLYRQALSSRPALNRYVEHVYDRMDAANAWEVANTRAVVTSGTIQIPVLPDYGDRSVLAYRALGHVIGPMLITMLLPAIRPKQIDAVDQAMQSYLIARQLNDDLHDWRKDLRNGHLSTIVTDLLRSAQVKPAKYNLASLITRLERYFFAHGLYHACNQLRDHVSKSRRALADAGVCGGAGGFHELLNNLDESAVAAVGVQTDEQAFLDTYRELSPLT